jgi:hypothetical protein
VSWPTLAERIWDFLGWSDLAPQTHDVTVEGDTTLTGLYVPRSGGSRIAGARRGDAPPGR